MQAIVVSNNRSRIKYRELILRYKTKFNTDRESVIIAIDSDDCSKYTICVQSCKDSKVTILFIINIWSALIWVTSLIFKMLHILLVFAAVYTIYNYIVSTGDYRKFIKFIKIKEVQKFYKFFTLLTVISTSPVLIIIFTTLRAISTIEIALHLSQFHH